MKLVGFLIGLVMFSGIGISLWPKAYQSAWHTILPMLVENVAVEKYRALEPMSRPAQVSFSDAPNTELTMANKPHTETKQSSNNVEGAPLSPNPVMAQLVEYTKLQDPMLIKSTVIANSSPLTDSLPRPLPSQPLDIPGPTQQISKSWSPSLPDIVHDNAPDTGPDNAPETAPDSAQFESEDLTELTAENREHQIRWQPIWQSFYSRVSAQGFARQLEKIDRQTLRVVRLQNDRFQVELAYENVEALQAALQSLGSQTGLVLAANDDLSAPE